MSTLQERFRDGRREVTAEHGALNPQPSGETPTDHRILTRAEVDAQAQRYRERFRHDGISPQNRPPASVRMVAAAGV